MLIQVICGLICNTMGADVASSEEMILTSGPASLPGHDSWQVQGSRHTAARHGRVRLALQPHPQACTADNHHCCVSALLCGVMWPNLLVCFAWSCHTSCYLQHSYLQQDSLHSSWYRSCDICQQKQPPNPSVSGDCLLFLVPFPASAISSSCQLLLDRIRVCT